MKINLERLKEIEEKYKEQGLPNYTLHLMLSQVIAFEQAPFTLAPNNIVLAINTLKDLGILDMEGKKDPPKTQQLNS
jgi:hypothetical protein